MLERSFHNHKLTKDFGEQNQSYGLIVIVGKSTFFNRKHSSDIVAFLCVVAQKLQVLAVPNFARISASEAPSWISVLYASTREGEALCDVWYNYFLQIGIYLIRERKLSASSITCCFSEFKILEFFIWIEYHHLHWTQNYFLLPKIDVGLTIF